MSTATLSLAPNTAEQDASMDEPQDREERRSGTDRRHMSAWHDPRFYLGVIVFVASILGAVVTSHVVTQRQTTKLEMAAANLDQQASRMERQVETVVATVNTVSMESREMRATIASQAREIDDLKMAKSMAESRIIVLEKSVARLEARNGR